MTNLSDDLAKEIEVLAAAFGTTPEAIRGELVAHRAKVDRRNARAILHNRRAAMRAKGKPFAIKERGGAAFRGVIETCVVAESGVAFQVTLRGPTGLLFGPFCVRRVPN